VKSKEHFIRNKVPVSFSGVQNNSRQEFFILGIAVSQRAAKKGKIFPALQGRGGEGSHMN